MGKESGGEKEKRETNYRIFFFRWKKGMMGKESEENSAEESDKTPLTVRFLLRIFSHLKKYKNSSDGKKYFSHLILATPGWQGIKLPVDFFRQMCA